MEHPLLCLELRRVPLIRAGSFHCSKLDNEFSTYDTFYFNQSSFIFKNVIFTCVERNYICTLKWKIKNITK